MSDAYVFDPLDPTVPDRITEVHPSVNTPAFVPNPNTLINPVLTVTLLFPYWKESAGGVVDFTGPEVIAWDAFIANEQLLANRAQAASAPDDEQDARGWSSRSIFQTIKDADGVLSDEINAIQATLLLASQGVTVEDMAHAFRRSGGSSGANRQTYIDKYQGTISDGDADT